MFKGGGGEPFHDPVNAHVGENQVKSGGRGGLVRRERRLSSSASKKMRGVISPEPDGSFSSQTIYHFDTDTTLRKQQGGGGLTCEWNGLLFTGGNRPTIY